MKKIFYSVLVLIVFILTGCTKSNLKSLSLDDLYNKINNKDSFILYIDVDNSSLKDKLDKALTNNNLTGYTINASKIKTEEKLKLEPIISYDNSAIVFIVDGNDSSRLSHVTNSDTTIKELETRLKDMNFIK